MDKPPTTLDDIYSKLKTPSATKPFEGESFRLSSAVDGVLTTVNITAVQRWSLFEACLKSRDYERADLILQNLASKNGSKNPYYLDGVCEFLRAWGSEEGVKLDEVRNWIDHMSEMDASFKTDPRVYAWVIKLSFNKGLELIDIMREFYYYRLTGYGNTNADILRYVDIIGIFNVKKLVAFDSRLKDDIPQDYKDLFDILLSSEAAEGETQKVTPEAIGLAGELVETKQDMRGEVSEEVAEDHTDITSSTEKLANSTSDVVDTEANIDQDDDEDELSIKQVIKKAQERVIDLEKETEVIHNGIDELKSVSTWNLKAIRHSLLGLVNSYNQGEFIRKFAAEVDAAGLDLDTTAIMNDAENGKQINFFELKGGLPYAQQGQFDDVMDKISEDRQIVLEGTMIEAAKAKWDHEFENLKDKSMPSSIGSYLHNWLTQLVPLIEKDVEEYHKASQYFSEREVNPLENKASNYDEERYSEKMKYGPFLTLMKPEKIAIITILEVMKSAVTSDIARGVAVSKMVMAVSKAIELEYKSEKILASDVDVHRNFKAIKKTPEFKRFLRSTQAKRIIEEAEKKSMLVNAAETDSSKLLWDADSHCRVGSALVSMILQVAKVDVEGVDPKTGEVRKAFAPAFYHTYDFQNGGKVGVVKVNQKFASKLGKERLDQSIQAQYLPMISRPRPWTTYNDGGYYLKRCLVLRSKNAPEQYAYAKAAAMSGNMDQVLRGLNALGNTPWTVNKDILQTMTKVWNTGETFLEIPKAEEDLVMPTAPEKGAPPVEIFRFRRACQDACNEFAKNRSMRCDMNYKLEIARAFVGERIFFPHSLDFRGRAYPIPPHFNHLGNDLSRGLLRFWVGKKLGVDGLRWLKIHLCNLMGNDKISLDDRVKFTEDHLDDIIDSAADPLGGRRWWMKADHPWQFLASAFELSEAVKLDDPAEFISHQPVHQDGTCNGLQHYAALGGDIEGARHVNLIPADKPSDIYTRVSRIVQAAVDKDVANKVPEALATHDIIKRKLVKQTVMTSVYGVTYVGARAQITKRLKEIDFDEDEIAKCSVYLTDKVFKAIRELFDGAHAIQDWLALAAKRISKSVRLDIDLDDDAEFLSSVIWTSPLGLPVVQPYRTYKTRQVRTNLQTLVIHDPYEIKKVDARKQASGFPPNFVHSLDATHMLMSVNRCSEQGLSFSSVHDSYWTHACDITLMNKILREEFVKLHKNSLVSKLRSEFMMRYGSNVMVVQTDKNSDAAKAVKAFRKELSKKLGRTCQLGDEIRIEKERRDLLESKDPEQVKLGQQLKSSLSVLEDIGYDHTCQDDNQGSFTLLVPFSLPPVPPRGLFDVSIVQKSQYFFS
ncbi:DEKNAAC101802 [Brettanomyces naardenensis]|uniref:DNA-directed RNA polymerase n=1 Tax=Brettanomyces naardenensis TaxID=13370 RepID=A0A448YJB1_BRENA|nr:DEKNAAC101802 [Brettanomyces naardenensis]